MDKIIVLLRQLLYTLCMGAASMHRKDQLLLDYFRALSWFFMGEESWRQQLLEWTNLVCSTEVYNIITTPILTAIDSMINYKY